MSKITLRSGRVSILINRESTEIEIYDSDSALVVTRIILSPEQLSACLSRQAMVEANAVEYYCIEKIGKKHENKMFEFEINESISSSKSKSALNQKALIELQQQNMQEWEPDKNYSSQNSFFTKDGKHFARTVIRRWT